jgi:hypothetical protein
MVSAGARPQARSGGDWRRYADSLEQAIGSIIAEERGQARLCRNALQLQIDDLEKRLGALEKDR